MQGWGERYSWLTNDGGVGRSGGFKRRSFPRRRCHHSQHQRSTPKLAAQPSTSLQVVRPISARYLALARGGSGDGGNLHHRKQRRGKSYTMVQRPAPSRGGSPLPGDPLAPSRKLAMPSPQPSQEPRHLVVAAGHESGSRPGNALRSRPRTAAPG